MNSMKKLVLMAGLLAMSATSYAVMHLELDNEGSTEATVTFSKPLKNGHSQEKVPAKSKETVEVGHAWLNADVTVTWSTGDVDTVHFKNETETLRSASDDDEKDGHTDDLSH